MANYSSILAWRIPWTEGPGSLHSMGSQRVDKLLGLGNFHFFTLIQLAGPPKNHSSAPWVMQVHHCPCIAYFFGDLGIDF